MSDNASPYRLPIITHGDLMDLVLPEEEPIIDGLLNIGEVAVLSASPKVGKSFALLQAALCVGTGTKWLGKFPCRKGMVLVIDNELATREYRARAKAMERAMNLNPTEVALTVSHCILDGDGRSIFEIEHALESEVGTAVGGVIVFDSLYQFLPSGCDENSNKDMREVLNAFRRIAKRHQCGCLIAHHKNKGIQVKRATVDLAAGAGVIGRAANTLMVLEPVDKKSGRLELSASVRGWPGFEKLPLRFEYPLITVCDDDGSTSAEEGGNTRTRASMPPVDETQFLERCIPTSPDSATRVQVIKAAKQIGISRRDAEELLKALVDRGLVVKTPGKSNRPDRYHRNPLQLSHSC